MAVSGNEYEEGSKEVSKSSVWNKALMSPEIMIAIKRGESEKESAWEEEVGEGREQRVIKGSNGKGWKRRARGRPRGEAVLPAVVGMKRMLEGECVNNEGKNGVKRTKTEGLVDGRDELCMAEAASQPRQVL